MIEFAHAWVFLLLPLPAAAWFLVPPRAERGAVRVPASVYAHLQGLSGPGSALARFPVGLALRGIGWTAIVFALAGPFTPQPPLLKPTGRDVFVALDLSASMAETDMTVAEEQVTRISVIRDKLASFLLGRQGDRVALIGFATEAFLIAPLTFDVNAVAEMLSEAPIGMPGRKTDLGQAIGLTVKLLSDERPGDRVLLLISDGETNAGELAARDAAELAAGLGIKIITIGFAGQIGDESIAHMAELAQMTGGSFLSATNPELMKRVYESLEAVMPIEPDETGAQRQRDWRWVAILAALGCIACIGWQEARDP